ncbi:DUF2809 domain-containing protein [Spirosoma sp. SC4-14]|uniref:ribosomal maturation YjgA family protein n=1 Tax=Spirosoma sp. SC4-14 TaxID=3128900 RepID=UPI0030CFE8BA
MNNLMQFNRYYFFWVILLLAVEILIAQFAHDPIIRPYVGDLLVVILVYCFIKSFIPIPVRKAALAALLFAYAIECLQYFQVIRWLGLEDSKLARTLIGTYFEWIDMLAYTIGILLTLWIETIRTQQAKKQRANLPF